MEQEIKLTKRQLKREKRKERLKQRLIESPDIKYRGPMSYRYLRAIAWIGIIVAQILVVNNIVTKMSSAPVISEGWQVALQSVSNLSIPLFSVAIFAQILNRKTSYKSTIISYLAIYLLIGVSTLIITERYVISALNAFVEDASFVRSIMGDLTGSLLDFNVFADLLVFALLNFFISYQPTKYFQGKKIIFFRLLVIFPILFVGGSLTIKVLHTLGKLSLPLGIYPFLTTKSIFLHLLFVLIVLWFKNREKIFLKLGATPLEFQNYLKTNRNSLGFSGQVSVLFFFFSIIDIFTYAILATISEMSSNPIFSNIGSSLGVGQCFSLFLAIPIIMLFSYTRTHKLKVIDLLLPIVAIAIILFVYLEGFREMMLAWAASLAEM